MPKGFKSPRHVAETGQPFQVRLLLAPSVHSTSSVLCISLRNTERGEGVGSLLILTMSRGESIVARGSKRAKQRYSLLKKKKKTSRCQIQGMSGENGAWKS